MQVKEYDKSYMKNLQGNLKSKTLEFYIMKHFTKIIQLSLVHKIQKIFLFLP